MGCSRLESPRAWTAVLTRNGRYREGGSGHKGGQAVLARPVGLPYWKCVGREAHITKDGASVAEDLHHGSHLPSIELSRSAYRCVDRCGNSGAAHLRFG